MKYVSTRGSDAGTTFSEAVVKGLAPDGGLFVPEEDVCFSHDDLAEMLPLTYTGLAARIMSAYADDFTADELLECAQKAYGDGKFPEITVPVTTLDGSLSVMELWHGPTCAFKDMALQMLPRLMVKAVEKCGEKKEITILTATSGDTGKAALEGFRDVPGIKVMVFFPDGGVSETQRLQMVTQEGSNVSVCAIKGNFDNAQTGVKRIFGDKAFAAELAASGRMLSSANSINWGRLLPQIVYYFHTYLELVRRGAVLFGDRINFCVPTGNFGDILACYYAKKAGLPVGKIICASNTNSVVSDFIRTGVYDKNRPFEITMSPAMDILVSSNLERLIHDASGRNPEYVAGLMAKLSSEGAYTVDRATQNAVDADFASGSATEAETMQTISEVYRGFGYLIDPHTAVGVNVYGKYREASGDGTRTVCVSTASPFKFNASVAESLFGKEALRGVTEADIPGLLEQKTGEPVPKPLAGLFQKKIRFTDTVEVSDMKKKAEEFIYE
ncbi:MAG: threonine synthase [Clostridia bacterium]|nr:threonine synthase [Clostridia bacterium]